MKPVAYVAFEDDGRVKYAFKTQMDGGSPSVPVVRLSDAEARIRELERDLRIAIEQRNMTLTEMQGQTDRAEVAEARIAELEDARAEEWRKRREAEASRDTMSAVADTFEARAEAAEALLNEALPLISEFAAMTAREDRAEAASALLAKIGGRDAK